MTDIAHRHPRSENAAADIYKTARYCLPQMLTGLGQIPGEQLDKVARRLGLPKRAGATEHGDPPTRANDADYIRQLAAFLAFEAAEALEAEAVHRGIA